MFEDNKQIEEEEFGAVGIKRMSKQIPSSCSTEDPGRQRSGDSAENQLGPVNQTGSTAGAVCMDQQPALHSSATTSVGEKNKGNCGPSSTALHYFLS